MDKWKVLVVEDDPPVRNLITVTLSAEDYSVFSAVNGSEAVSEAAGEAISEEMSMAMINYMPIRGALSFGGGLPEDVVQDMLRQMNE